MDKLKVDENSEEIIEEDPISAILRLQYLLVMLLSAIGSIAILALMISPRLQVMDQMIEDMSIEAPQRLKLLRGLNHHWSFAILIYSSLALLAAPALTLARSNRTELRIISAIYILTLTLPITALDLTLSLGYKVNDCYRSRSEEATDHQDSRLRW